MEQHHINHNARIDPGICGAESAINIVIRDAAGHQSSSDFPSLICTAAYSMSGSPAASPPADILGLLPLSQRETRFHIFWQLVIVHNLLASPNTAKFASSNTIISIPVCVESSSLPVPMLLPGAAMVPFVVAVTLLRPTERTVELGGSTADLLLHCVGTDMTVPKLSDYSCRCLILRRHCGKFTKYKTITYPFIYSEVLEVRENISRVLL
jgi:hypothetical protein